MTGNNEILYVVGQVPRPGYETVFDKWYDEEHIPELLTCPGFVSAQRFQLIGGRGEAPASLAIYTVAGVDAFESLEYRRQAERAPNEMTRTARSATSHRTVLFAAKYRGVSTGQQSPRASD